MIIRAQMPPSQVVGDPTDPTGTLRPNLPPEPETGDRNRYIPMPHPEFHHEINLPVDSMDPIAIFDLFFGPEQLATLVASTNKHGLRQSQIGGPRRKRALDWIDITIGELYAYLGILIYMDLHIENQTKDYWTTDKKRPSHLPVQHAMSRERFQQISTAFHISSNSSKSVFSMVY